jgi:hypothetical protein
MPRRMFLLRHGPSEARVNPETPEASAAHRARRRRATARSVLGWALVASFLAWVALRLDLALVRRCWSGVWLPGYAACIALFSTANLLLDVLATKVTYDRTVAPVGFRALLTVRGASYLPGVISFHAGQAFVVLLSSRLGAPLGRVAGATLATYATTFGALIVAALVSLPWARALAPGLVGPVLALSLAGVAYLGLLALRPAWLARRPLTAALIRLGVRGHLLVLSVRLLQVLCLGVGTWAAYALAGVQLPTAAAAAYLPPFLLISALPITPQGIGARDAVALWLFLPWASSAEEVAAAGVLLGAFGALVQVVVGALFWPACRAWMRAPPPDAAQRGTGPGDRAQPSRSSSSRSSHEQ